GPARRGRGPAARHPEDGGHDRRRGQKHAPARDRENPPRLGQRHAERGGSGRAPARRGYRGPHGARPHPRAALQRRSRLAPHRQNQGKPAHQNP
nr:hypothetical protein [Tanacetum cinerariifolium]